MRGARGLAGDWPQAPDARNLMHHLPIPHFQTQLENPKKMSYENDLSWLKWLYKENLKHHPNHPIIMSSAEKPTSRKQRQAANRSLQGLHWQLEEGRGQRHLPEALGLTSIEDQECKGEMEEKCVEMSSFDSKNKSCNMHTPLAPLVFQVMPQILTRLKHWPSLRLAADRFSGEM